METSKAGYLSVPPSQDRRKKKFFSDKSAALRTIFGLASLQRRYLENLFKEWLGTDLMRLVKACQDQSRPDDTKPDHNIGLKKAIKHVP